MTRNALARIGLAAGIVLGAGLVLALLALLLLVPERLEPHESSAYSAEPSGLRALFLALRGLGLPVAAWSSAPAELAAAGTLLVLPDLPAQPELVPAGAPEGGRDLEHYRRFVEAGGTLLVLGEGGDELDFLCAAGLPGCEELTFFGTQVARAELELPDGSHLTLDPGPNGSFDGAGAEVLLRTSAGETASVSLACGAGRVVLLSLAGDAFANERLQHDAAPALLFVRVVEALGPFERILFDEYALGGWVPPSVLALAFRPRFAWLSAHLLLLVLVLGWRSAWSGPFARDPRPLLAASPLARAQGFARTLARAGRWDLLARLLQRGLLERWCARAGLRAPPADAAGRSEPVARTESLRLLARGDAELLQRLEAAAGEHLAVDEARFEALADELAALERELFPAEGTKNRAHGGPPAAATGS